MARIVDFKASEPRRRVKQHRPVRIPHSPRQLVLATVHIRGANENPRTKVELQATVGVRGVTGISQLKFRIFRDGREIFNTQQGVESAGSEQTYTIAFQAVDLHARRERHQYRLTVENMTRGASASVVGPVVFSALAVSRS